MEASIPTTKSSVLTLPNFDRLIRWCLFLYLFSLPFKGLLFVERNGFIVLLALFTLWCVLNRRLFFVRTQIDIPLAVFALWVLVTIPFAAYPLYSLQEFGKLLQQGLVLYATIYFFRDKSSVIQLVWMFIAVLLAVALYGLMHYQKNDPQSMTSFLPAEVWLTTYLVMLIPFSAALAWYENEPWTKGVYVFAAMLAVCCLLLAQSRAGILALFAELWIFAFLVNRRRLLIAAGVITSVALIGTISAIKVVTLSDGSLHLESTTSIPIKVDTVSVVHRLDIWSFMLARIAEHPVVGIGYGKETSKMLFGQVPEVDIVPGHAPVRKHGTHNILLELALHVGVPGALLFFWLAARLGRVVFIGYRQATDILAKAILLAVGVGMCGMAVRIMFDQMLVGTLAIQFWVFVALAIIATSSFRVPAGQEPHAV